MPPRTTLEHMSDILLKPCQTLRPQSKASCKLPMEPSSIPICAGSYTMLVHEILGASACFAVRDLRFLEFRRRSSATLRAAGLDTSSGSVVLADEEGGVL